MEPTLYNDEYVLVNRLVYYINSPQRGDEVILRFPGDPEHKKYIKRVIGLPGEKIELNNGYVYINGRKLIESYLPNTTKTNPYNLSSFVIDENNYFLMGDNRENSSDSRIWGTCPGDDIIGKAFFRIIPLKKFGLLDYAAY